MSASIESDLARLLRGGVLAAGAVVAAGALWFLAVHGGDPADYRTWRGEPDGLRRVSALLRSPLLGEGKGIIQLGILILVATPIARVAFSVAAFARAGNRPYVAITLTVLLILLYSVFAGH
jgi:uncharacterized membrane protein